MATNWPPISFPAWPPAELNTTRLEFSNVKTGIDLLLEHGFTRANPTAQENNDYFKNVRCDEGHPCQGIMIVSPGGVRYPFAYCTGATHKSALVLWDVSHGTVPGGAYDLGWNSGDIV
jgi:hypothetical protein